MAAVSNLIHAGVSPQGHIVLSFIYNKHASLFELQILYSAAELWARLTANTQTGKHLSVVISIQGVHFSPICPFLSTVVRIAWPWETHNNNERLPIASREHQIHLYPLDELTLFFHPDFFLFFRSADPDLSNNWNSCPERSAYQGSVPPTPPSKSWNNRTVLCEPGLCLSSGCDLL